MTYFRYPIYPSIHPCIHPSIHLHTLSPKAPILMRPCILRHWCCLMHPVQTGKKVR
jgi:hypothetical protein